MTTFRSENLLVAVVALGCCAFLAQRMWQAQRGGEAYLGRLRVRRAEAPTKYAALVAIGIALVLLLAWISADLLIGLTR